MNNSEIVIIGAGIKEAIEAAQNGKDIAVEVQKALTNQSVDLLVNLLCNINDIALAARKYTEQRSHSTVEDRVRVDNAGRPF